MCGGKQLVAASRKSVSEKGGAWERNDESNQMLGTIRQGTGDNGYVSERKVPPKHGFHVLGLNSVAVHLELIIDCGQENAEDLFRRGVRYRRCGTTVRRIFGERVLDEFFVA